MLISIPCQSRPDPVCAGSLRALILEKLQCAERGRSSLFSSSPEVPLTVSLGEVHKALVVSSSVSQERI